MQVGSDMKTRKNSIPVWLIALLLISILAVGGYLRLVGLDWDAEQHLHPDERFLTMVESSLLPVANLGEYFDTAASTLNPANKGHSFFVYGTFPIFIVRYAAEWVGSTGYGSVYLVGRSLSAVFDLLTIFVVFMIGTRLLDRRLGLLAAAFYAFSVLPIQQSHFFTVDAFITFFSVLAVYFAVEVAACSPETVRISSFIFFGAALGMAVASKINAAPVALTLPFAVAMILLREDREGRNQHIARLFVYLVGAALISLVVFRILQPYAFQGPGFFNFRLNENWVGGLKALQAQTSGDVDFPPALQWARRPLYFSLQNMVLWGFGIPLGILSWVGFVWFGLDHIRSRKWGVGLVVWSWTALYFSWQSLQWNSTMRYQYPIYPLLVLFASWLIFTLWERSKTGWRLIGDKLRIKPGIGKVLTVGLGLLVLLLTAAWGYAFSRIYTTPHPRVAATEWIFQNIPGPANLIIQTGDGEKQQLVSYPAERIIQAGQPWSVTFSPRWSGSLKEIFFPNIIAQNEGQVVRMEASILASDTSQKFSRTITLDLTEGETSAEIQLEKLLPLNPDESYQLQLNILDSAGAVSLKGAGIANESSWDDGLPLRLGGYDPFGGIYQGGLNFEMYWDDNQEKLKRFLTTMYEADTILITSSRQWATTTRLPERYPLTSRYYQELMGCPGDIRIERCYTQALPGMYEGQLGFELVKVFQSSPTLGPIQINDQYAEEAFTVYDHPKVFVFQKTNQFNLTETASILGEVDLDRVIHITPKQADNHPGDLMLPEDQLEIQRDGGTWSQLFNSDSLLNRSQVISVIVWYLAVFMLGLAVFSLLRPVIGGLKDHGYPLSRVFGLLLLSYLSWLAGSLNIPYQKSTIAGVGFLILLAGTAAAYLQREQILEQWKTQRKYLLLIEGLALAVFLVGLLIRFGNPDLWHPWKGGEKPMDFSYFNAVLKSTSIPPYDPWFAGGYINYYYYGFVLVGTLVKLLGITPAVAYNLILPTVLMLTGIGVFSIVWNIAENERGQAGGSQRSLAAGGAGLLAMILLGNLGVIRMFLQGIQRLASGGINPVEGGFFQRLLWTAVGLLQFFRTGTLGYRLDEWYWNPSRVIGAEHGGPITEFPFFTFLYGDLHAHFLALPLTVLALAWVVSLALSRKNGLLKEGWLQYLALPVFGALVVGALRPTNTWDYYPYLALGIAAIGFSWIGKQDHRKPVSWLKAGVQIALFVFLTSLLYQPYLNWYGAGYTSVKNWYGTKTPLIDYFTHWGLFLIVILSWMAAETIQWMASTPASALKKLKPVRELILGLLLLMLVIMLSQGTTIESGFELGGVRWIGAGVHVIWFVLPVMVWAGIMLLRPGLSAAKQVVIVLIGTGLAITLMVELVYVEGDIGRMNTVFKFYLQTWTLFAVSGGAGFGWLLSSINKWPKKLSMVWKAVFFALLFGAALYPVLGGVAKIKDRMAPEAPSTLDGMLFMKYADYNDLNTELDLEEDYHAIRWMQENVQGSPVIVESNQVEYHWGTRYTVYTGNPGVVGWNWHQRQQRTTVPHNWVFDRVEDVNLFYDTTDLGFARDFLEKYQVEYIVVGQLERAKYAGDGLEKFAAAAGVLWEEVYQQGDTIIYRTISTSMP